MTAEDAAHNEYWQTVLAKFTSLQGEAGSSHAEEALQALQNLLQPGPDIDDFAIEDRDGQDVCM